jgi:DNA-3-methyladenine glycosylase I
MVGEIDVVVKARCPWCGTDPLYVKYHDEEWGVPLRDGRALFELLMLEGQQAGLSWITVLRKRERMRTVFCDFQPPALARMSDAAVAAALADPGVIRHRGKIEALIRNARAWLALESERDPVEYLWSFVDGAPIVNAWSSMSEVPASTPTSKAMSVALKRRGFAFVGPTTCYAFMQAAGLVDDHLQDCFRRGAAAR